MGVVAKSSSMSLKKRLFLSFLFGVLMWSSAVQLTAAPTIYPYLHQPEDYEEFYRRETPPATWDLFDHQMRIKSASSYTNFKNDIFAGRIMRIEEKHFKSKDDVLKYRKEMEAAKRAGYFIRLAGFKIYRVKGLDVQNYNERVDVEDSYADISRAMYDIWGERYFGMQFGESDASYLNLSAPHVFPFSRTREGNMVDFMDHYQWYSINVGNRVMSHHNESLWPYACNDAATTLGGAQTFYRGNTNPRIHYAFFRGMGKQYGLLWQGGLSGNNVWKSEKFEEELKGKIRAAGLPVEPTKDNTYPLRIKGNRERRQLYNLHPLNGSGIGMLRRMTYSMYAWNSMFFDYEIGALKWTAKGEDSQLSPNGEMFNHFDKFVKTYGSPGPMQTPVAFMTDYMAGWRVPGKERQRLSVWNCLPYEQGDFLLLNLFNVVYPNHFNLPLHKDKRYMLTDTPYGDITDALTHDVRQEVLNRYGLVILGTELNHDLETVRWKLDDYLSQGGQLVMTAANASKLYPEWGIENETTLIRKGDRIHYSEGGNEKETLEYSVLMAKSMPNDARVIAAVNDVPVAYEIPSGKGSITCVMSAYGMNDKAFPMEWPPSKKAVRKGDEKAVAWMKNPAILKYSYRLSNVMKSILDQKLSAQKLFSVGDNLGYIVNHREDQEYLVSIFNDTLESQPFTITSHIGEIESIKELSLSDQYLKQDPSFFPRGYQDKLSKQSASDDHIMGNDVRIFSVKVKKGNVRVLPEMKPARNARDRFIAVKSLNTLRHQLIRWPAYKRYFEGVKITGQMLLNTDADWLVREAKIFNRDRLRFFVDARDVNKTPDLIAVVAKMSILDGAKDIVLENVDTSLKSLLKRKSIRVCTTNDFQYIDSTRSEEAKLGLINVLNMFYDQWDDVYHDIRVVWEGAEAANFRGDAIGEEYNHHVQVQPKNTYHYLTLRGDIDDLPEAIMSVPKFFTYFGGVNIDARYLAACSDIKIAKDAEWLQSRGIGVTVDFSSMINNYKNITLLKQQSHQYEWSMAFFDQAFKKMKQLGADHAIIIAAKKNKKDSVENAIHEVAIKAAKQGIQLNIRTRGGMIYRKGVEFIQSIDAENVSIACSTMTDRDPSSIIREDSKKDMKILLLSSSSKKTLGNISYPVSRQAGGDISIKKLAGKKIIQVLDAEYLNEGELLEDVRFMGW
ncbi:hypothetical protein [Poriferisphaera sp. WC338]|uniref:hypothetical protein n=1 Tax=Poriferisphaera sp. WC338 TaxID=3425129 RepID=UPI003D81B487